MTNKSHLFGSNDLIKLKSIDFSEYSFKHWHLILFKNGDIVETLDGFFRLEIDTKTAIINLKLSIYAENKKALECISKNINRFKHIVLDTAEIFGQEDNKDRDFKFLSDVISGATEKNKKYVNFSYSGEELC